MLGDDIWRCSEQEEGLKVCRGTVYPVSVGDGTSLMKHTTCVSAVGQRRWHTEARALTLSVFLTF